MIFRWVYEEMCKKTAKAKRKRWLAGKPNRN